MEMSQLLEKILNWLFSHQNPRPQSSH